MNFKHIIVLGRVVWNIWRLVRTELKLLNYDCENVFYEIMNVRHPVYSNWTLTLWLNSQLHSQKALVFEYFLNKLTLTRQILTKLDIVQKTTSSARLYGCDFESIVKHILFTKLDFYSIICIESSREVLNSESKES